MAKIIKYESRNQFYNSLHTAQGTRAINPLPGYSNLLERAYQRINVMLTSRSPSGPPPKPRVLSFELSSLSFSVIAIPQILFSLSHPLSFFECAYHSAVREVTIYRSSCKRGTLRAAFPAIFCFHLLEVLGQKLYIKITQQRSKVKGHELNSSC